MGYCLGLSVLGIAVLLVWLRGHAQERKTKEVESLLAVAQKETVQLQESLVALAPFQKIVDTVQEQERIQAETNLYRETTLQEVAQAQVEGVAETRRIKQEGESTASKIMDIATPPSEAPIHSAPSLPARLEARVKTPLTKATRVRLFAQSVSPTTRVPRANSESLITTSPSC